MSCNIGFWKNGVNCTSYTAENCTETGWATNSDDCTACDQSTYFLSTNSDGVTTCALATNDGLCIKF